MSVLFHHYLCGRIAAEWLINMKIHLLIANSDCGYVEHLSRVLTENYADTFEVIVCSSEDKLIELLEERRLDIALIEPSLADHVPLSQIRLPLLLWDGIAELGEQSKNITKIRKYQRISTLAGQVLERYAGVSSLDAKFDGEQRGQITLVWAPAGGCGKTTTALAYTAQKVSEGKRVVYLDLEPFSSTPVYFREDGKSISSVFEKLDGNVDLLLQSIRQTDSGSGIFYFCHPDNYDDIAILTAEDMEKLIISSAKDVDEVVVDMGSAFDQRIAEIMELADQIMIVIDNTQIARMKWQQFRTQHCIYEKIDSKILMVANRGASFEKIHRTVLLPLVQSDDPVVVYKILSAGYFKE